MNRFPGNILEVFNKDGESLLVMAASAYHSLLPQQISMFKQFKDYLRGYPNH